MSRHASIVGLRQLARVDPRPRPLLWWATSKALSLIHGLYGGVQVVLEDPPIFTEPVMFAMNHSHYFDFMPSRRALWDQLGIRTVGFVKARAYQNRLERPFLERIGNIPLVSRGYLISADFAGVHRRMLREDEYRALREHVDHGAPLPDEPTYRAVLTQPRDMLDVGFDPGALPYREAIHACYTQAMATTLDHARTVLAAGHSLHIYPQGLYSTRLSRGRIGAVQFAQALGIPIVPIGLSGMNELFTRDHLVPHTRGTVTMRFGAPRRIHGPEFDGFEPFVPREELRLGAVLERETAALMQAINELLDPGYQWGEDINGDGLEGVSRFFD